MTHDSSPPPVSTLDLSLTERIIEHMNDDHSDALLLYTRAFGHIGDATAARMLAIDRMAMTLEYDQPTGSGIVHIAFNPPLSDLKETRTRLVALANEARRTLGITS